MLRRSKCRRSRQVILVGLVCYAFFQLVTKVILDINSDKGFYAYQATSMNPSLSMPQATSMNPSLSTSQFEFEVTDKPGTMTSQQQVVTLSLKSEERQYKMVVGITTALRRPPTLLWTSKDLIRNEVNHLNYKFLVWQSFQVSNDTVTRTELEKIGYTVFTQRTPYPELADDQFHVTRKDAPERVRWRTNHVLDYANLMERALEFNTDYILMLEDDMKPSKNALEKAYTSLEQHLRHMPIHQVGFVSLYAGRKSLTQSRGMKKLSDGDGGACAILYPKAIIPTIIKVLRDDPYDNPVDVIINYVIRVKMKLQVLERVPHLFQHISMKSTYNSTVQMKENQDQYRSSMFLYDEDDMTVLLAPSDSQGYVGCYNDNPLFRDLNGHPKPLSNVVNPIQQCKQFCKDYLFFGIQDHGRNCFCGNEFGHYGPSNRTNCSLRKYGVHGSHAVNAVYRTTPFTAKYIGCYADNRNKHDLPHFKGTKHKPTSCLQACSRHKYFGLQFGGECYCGSSYGRYGNGSCATYCSTDIRLMCGGSLSNSVFQILSG